MVDNRCAIAKVVLPFLIFLQRRLNDFFGLRIDISSRFIQNQDFGLAAIVLAKAINWRSPLENVEPFFRNFILISLWQLLDTMMSIDEFARQLHFFVCNILVHANIGSHCSMEQEWILQHESDFIAKDFL